MAFEHSAFLDDSYGTSAASIMNYRAPPVLSETHVIFNRAHCDQYFHATKDEYQGSVWPKTTTSAYRAPIPPPPRVGYVFPSVTRREAPPPPPPTQPTAVKPITSDEAARIFGGFVITEYRNKKHYYRA